MSPDGDAIRPAVAADVPRITALVDGAYAHYVARIGRRPGPMTDDYSARVAAGEAWVVEVEGVLAGLAVVLAEPTRVLLDNVAVDPGFQRRGLGRRLIAFAEAQARARGAPALELYTHSLMTENIDLYRRMGFVETRRVIEDGFDRVYMRKQLAAAP